MQCAWFQAACNPRSSHGWQCSAMLHLLLYVVKRQLTICFKLSKPIQIGLCMLMCLSITGLHLDAQYGQTWHVDTITQWRQDWSLASVVNHIIITDPNYPTARFQLGMLIPGKSLSRDESRNSRVSTETLDFAWVRTFTLSLIHIWRCRRLLTCRSRWSPYH